MRILVAADMDGIAGITHPAQLFEGGNDYDRACRLMTADVNAAIEGALQACPEATFVVADGHAGGRNLRIEDLHPAAELLCGPMHWLNRPLSQLPDPAGCHLAFLVGFHARAGVKGGLLAHTWAGPVVAEVRLAGRPAGETAINAAILAAWGIAVGLASGADDLQPEVEALGSDSVFALTKRALGRTAALCDALPAARRRITEAAAEAVARQRAGLLRPFVPGPGPAVMEVDCHRREQADLACGEEGIERAGERTVRAMAADYAIAARRMWRALCRAQDAAPGWLQ
ncbi:MAG: M55 family metallopeptidase [Planctomycetes bacterium]|nr:M55 family metallopeptidase [Planctomycetota bacterium]